MALPIYNLQVNVWAKDFASGPLTKFKDTLATLAKLVIGGAAGSGLLKVGKDLAGIGRQALSATTFIQNFSIALETLVSREAVLAGMFGTVEEALKSMKPYTTAILRDLREMSLTTPFDPETVANTFRLNMAYGATVVARSAAIARADPL